MNILKKIWCRIAHGKPENHILELINVHDRNKHILNNGQKELIGNFKTTCPICENQKLIHAIIDYSENTIQKQFDKDAKRILKAHGEGLEKYYPNSNHKTKEKALIELMQLVKNQKIIKDNKCHTQNLENSRNVSLGMNISLLKE